MATTVLDCTVAGVGPVAVRLRPLAINLLVGDEQPSYSFDLAGRLIGAFVDGVNYRRGLDGRVLRKHAGQEGRVREWLAPEQASEFVSGAYRLAQAVAESCGDDRLAPLVGWTDRRIEEDVAAFRQIYRPVSILPPDQYLALVLQATEGCSYNRCTFCSFYRDRPFRIKDPAELRAHIEQVRAFFGPALALRRSLFLADANALVAALPRVHAWLDEIDAAGIQRPGGIFSFIDAFDAGRKSRDEWAELAARGLRRVYIGMESGDDALLRFLRKPGTAGDVVDAVRTLKGAGVGVGVIIMTGIGGSRFAGDHVAHTLAALQAMPLTREDLVYFSPFFEQPGSEYEAIAAAEGLTPLSWAEAAQQEDALRAALKNYWGVGSPLLARYDIREFVY